VDLFLCPQFTISGRNIQHGMGSNMIEFVMKIHRETEKAFLLSDDGDEKKAIWLPKSQVNVLEEMADEHVRIEVPEWLAQKQNLI
jgi:hypothetical protein